MILSYLFEVSFDVPSEWIDTLEQVQVVFFDDFIEAIHFCSVLLCQIGSILNEQVQAIEETTSGSLVSRGESILG